MAAVTLLGAATFDTNAGTKTVTATPAVGDLIVIVTAHTANTSVATPTDDQAGTYTLVESAVKNSSLDTLAIFVRDALIPSAVSTIFTHAPGTTTGGGLAVLKVTGMTRVGANAAKHSGLRDNETSGNTPSVNFGFANIIDSANPLIGAVFNAQNPAAITPSSTHIERLDTGYALPNAGLEIQSRNNGGSGSIFSWNSASGTNYCCLGIELDTSSGAATYNETLSEEATASDSLTSTGTFGVTLSESATASFGPTDAEPIAASLTETATASASFIASSPIDINSFGFRALQWSLVRPDSILRSGWTGARTIVAAPWAARWRARADLAAIQGEADMRAVKSFLAQRKGKISPFRLYATTEAQNANTGVTVASDAAQGAVSMDISSVTDDLLDGQFVTVNAQLVCLTEDQDGATITFQPPLRQAAAAGTTVQTSRPYAFVHLSSSSVGWQAGPRRLFGVSLDVEEAILEADAGIVPGGPSEARFDMDTITFDSTTVTWDRAV